MQPLQPITAFNETQPWMEQAAVQEQTLTVGSLCSGVGGDILALKPLGYHPIWFAEIDTHAAAVLTHRWPDVPNLGDVKNVDWAATETPDLLTAGYPCQPFSQAGHRKGTNDERHLWPNIFDAIRHLRPANVLLENVRGHLTLGFDQVLADLASIGFDAEWGIMGSHQIGAPHRRDRLWVLATDASSARRWEVTRSAFGDEATDGQPLLNHIASSAGALRVEATEARHVNQLLPTPTASDSHGAQGPNRKQAPKLATVASALLPTPRASDSNGPGTHGTGGHDLRTAIDLLPTPTLSDGSGGHHAPSLRWEGGTAYRPSGAKASVSLRESLDVFYRYEDAIERWGTLHGPAPSPTITSPRTGKQVLNPELPEWMMGFPPRWVTDPELGIPRTQQLRCIGNAIQPQTCAAAFTALQERATNGTGHRLTTQGTAAPCDHCNL